MRRREWITTNSAFCALLGFSGFDWQFAWPKSRKWKAHWRSEADKLEQRCSRDVVIQGEHFTLDRPVVIRGKVTMCDCTFEFNTTMSGIPLVIAKTSEFKMVNCRARAEALCLRRYSWFAV